MGVVMMARHATSVASPRAFFYRAGAAARYATRPFLGGTPRAVSVVAIRTSSPAAAPASASAMTMRTCAQTSRDGVVSVAGVRSFRYLSSTANCLAEEREGRDSAQPTTSPSPSPLSSSLSSQEESRSNSKPNQQQQQQPQHQPKGIRKVLPSLTPHENVYTVPNLLTFSRIATAPFIGYAILHDAHVLALGLFAYAGASDLLDGWIARRWRLQTVVGSVVDPMADKMLMTVLTISLAMQGALPVWLATIILGRDVGLGVAAIYYRWISLPAPKTFMRYWDFSLPSAEVRPTTISKYNTFLQLGLMGATMVAPVVTVDVGAAMTAFQYLVATTTIWSGLSYVFSKDAVRILSESKNNKGRKP